jgi:tRNA(Ile)-lysidine synthase
MRGALDPAVATGRNLVRATLADVSPGSRVVIGVSGGADSLALAAVTAFVAEREAYDLRAVIVDHQLQQGSGEVASRAAAQLATVNVPAEIMTVEVGRQGGPEAAARAARYAVLENQSADVVLLAHTLDDQAETVLLGLGRGSGPRSIAGMSELSGIFRRPFLTLRRTDTEQICRFHGLGWWTDPHNSDPSYRRSRIRVELMPLLEDVLGGGVAEALARTAELIRDDLDFLDDLAARDETLDARSLLVMPAPVRSRILRNAALEAGARADELSSRHITAMNQLVTGWHGQVRVELPGGIACVRLGDALTFTATPVAG